MKKCRITVMRITEYEDLMAQYENPINHACDMEVGRVFIANGWEKPEGFCQSAGPEPWRREFLRRLDEEPQVRHALLQRRLPSGKLSGGGAGRGCRLRRNDP